MGKTKEESDKDDPVNDLELKETTDVLNQNAEIESEIASDMSGNGSKVPLPPPIPVGALASYVQGPGKDPEPALSDLEGLSQIAYDAKKWRSSTKSLCE